MGTTADPMWQPHGPKRERGISSGLTPWLLEIHCLISDSLNHMAVSAKWGPFVSVLIMRPTICGPHHGPCSLEPPVSGSENPEMLSVRSL